MRLEDDLPNAMRDSVRDLRPDVSVLVAGGLAGGRRATRRILMAKVVGTGTVLALAGGIAVALPLWGGGPGEPQVAGTTRITDTPSPSKPAPPRVATTSQAALQLLLAGRQAEEPAVHGHLDAS